MQVNISTTLDRVLWKLLNSIDQRKGGKVMKQADDRKITWVQREIPCNSPKSALKFQGQGQKRNRHCWITFILGLIANSSRANVFKVYKI